MSDLISRRELIKAMEKKYDLAEKKAFYSVGLSEGFIITEEIIKNQPPVEAVPVVHGEWIEFDVDYGGIPAVGHQCSECGRSNGFITDFCPNCGADMRGTHEEDK